MSALLALALWLAPAGAMATGDTARIVRHVRIGPAGIQIERHGSRDTVASIVVRSGGQDRRVVTIEASGEDAGASDARAVTVEGDDAGTGTTIVVNAGDAGIVRLFADAEVPAGKTIPGDVVAVFGSTDVAGTVQGDVVAVFGSVRLHPGARVEGDAVAIAGVLDQPPGALVNGQSVSVGLLLPGWGVPRMATLLLVVLLGWLATLFVAWMLALLFPERMSRIGTTASRHSAGSLFLGLVSPPLVVIACVLLVLTVVGIPFALLLPLVYLFAVWAGQVAGSYVLGCKLLRRRPGESGLMGPVFVGTLLIAVLFVLGAALSVPEGIVRTLSLFFTALGLLLIAGLSTLGTGALILSRAGSRPPGAPPAVAGGPGPP